MLVSDAGEEHLFEVLPIIFLVIADFFAFIAIVTKL